MNISAVYFNHTDETQQKNSININSNKDKTNQVDVSQLFSKAGISGDLSGINNGNYDKNSIKSMMSEADSVMDQIKNSADTAKMSFKALVSKVTDTDSVKMDEDGYGLNDMTSDKMITVVDRIKIMLATYCEDYQPVDVTGVSTDEIQQVVGSAAMANHVENKLTQADLPATQENVDGVTNALNQATQLTDLSEDAKNYLVKNQMEPTIENLYKAEHMSSEDMMNKSADSQYAGGLGIGQDAQNGSKNSLVAGAAGAYAQTGKNQIDPNAAGNAVFNNSGNGQNSENVTDDQWNELLQQIKELMERGGMEVSEKNLANAKDFVNRGIPVTIDTLSYKEQLDQLDLSGIQNQDATEIENLLNQMTDNMKMGNTPESTNLLQSDQTMGMVEKAITVLNQADLAEVVGVRESGKDLTIENLADQLLTNNSTVGQDAAGQNSNQTMTNPATDLLTNTNTTTGTTSSDAYKSALYAKLQSGELSAQDITNYRQLEEIRIRMTADAGLSLARQGFNLDTTPVAELVDQLKSMEAQLYGDKSEDVFEVQKAVDQIKTAPDAVIGAAMTMRSSNEKVTIGDFAELGSNLKQKYQAANETYEAVGTQVRSDLGDSLKSALKSSTDSILEDMGLENTQANQDAVRILAANGMDVTESNISKVKEIYTTLNNMIDNMHPDTVFNMIQDGINPMNEDISVVNNYLSEQNEKGSTDEKFSKFLYKLDKTNGITDEERSQFIGIYKMMNIFRKDAGRAVGALVKQNADITMSNLVSAYKSVKASGIDREVTDDTGLAEVNGTVNYYNNLFARSEKSLTPNTFKTVNSEQPVMERSVENFCEATQNAYDAGQESAYYQEMMAQITQASQAEDAVYQQVSENGEELTVNNILTAESVMSPDMFKKYYKVYADEDTESTSGTQRESADSTDKMDTDNSSARSADTDRVVILDDFIEHCISQEDLNSQYENLFTQTAQMTKQKIADIGENETSMTQTELESEYQSLEDMRMMGREIQMMQSMGRRNDYRIPFSVDGQVGTINLKLVQSEAQKGSISMKLSTAQLGDVSISVKMTDESTAYMQASSTKDQQLMAEKINAAAELLNSQYGIQLEDGSETQDSTESDSSLYQSGISGAAMFNQLQNAVSAQTAQTEPVTAADAQSQEITFNQLYQVSKEIMKAMVQ